MDIRKKVGQLLVIGFSGKTVPKEVKQLIHDYHIGAIILFGRNIGTPKEVLALTTELQMEAKKAEYRHPLLICVDQENGVVRRLGEGATIFPGAMTIGASGKAENAYKIGLASGKELKALGINWNLAPVLDVNNNPHNPVIGVRSFGESPEKVAEFGRASMQGMQAAKVVTTLKHFPGHGDTNVDSHLDLPIINHSMDRLEAVELKPFRASIEAGADTVMTAHVYFPSIEQEHGLPATLSKKVITGLLREKLQFDGVITTDCMEMNAIANGVGTEKGAVEALKAGVDFVMISHTTSKQVGAISEIIKAIESGELSESRIDESIARINKLKEKYLQWDEILSTGIEVPSTVGCPLHEKAAYEVYRESVTIVKNNHILPLEISENAKVLVIHSDSGTTMQVEDKRYANVALGEAVKEYHQNTDVVLFNNDLADEDIQRIVRHAKDFDFIIIGTLTLSKGNKQIELIAKLIEAKLPVIVVAMRSPYDLAYLPDVPAYINTYEFTYPALKVAAGAIFGKETVSGQLPVTIIQ
ncbi:beta-N-acetylhexosaminidase [Bacillus kwashiorkori]|uniref:beta-N-acetylhexosaminidase n=1 Tax=Bacillus kwashiorkori TaxID=1522318 RepID=UPI000781EBEA|nr:beta-N-acetylhexosaminidase [Bacillus kwashiorkori]